MRDYKGKYFSVLGDSISSFEGYSQPREAAYYDREKKIQSGVLTLADTWWGKVIESLEGELLVNNSISGSMVCQLPAYQVPSYGCSDERTSALDKDGVSPDVIMVYLGTNDWGAGIPITARTKGEDNLSLFANAYKTMLAKLKANYPNAEIWCLTLPISRCTAREGFAFPYCYAGRNILEYNDAILSCGVALDCRVIDLAKNEEFDTMDGFHPNVSGMETIAFGVIERLKK
jgi:lysophospholipase L1-like esterase